MKLRIIPLFVILLILDSIFLVNALPTYFDWKDKDGQNWMTSVKNQGTTCGSCWAFSVVGTMEAQYNIAKNQSNYDLDLSEEYLVSDCYQNPYSYSDCRGGINFLALSYIKNYGISNESCFPYNDYNCGTLKNGSCSSTTCTYYSDNKCSDYTCSDRCGNWQDDSYKIDNYEEVSPSQNITQIENWLVNHGPISVHMRTNNSYFDANLTYRCDTDLPTDHVVIITGYNQTGQYWIVKNSWGTAWPPGIGGGYFNVGFGECGIEGQAFGINLTLCECSNWTAGSCGGGSCSISQRQSTRTCNPSGCDTETKCEYDPVCTSGGGGTEITVCASGCNYTTIQNAINHSNAVDLVLVTDNRTYNEQIKMNFTTASRLTCSNNAIIKGSGSGIGINITNKDAFSISGCKIDGFSYGIRIRNTDNGEIKNAVVSNNAYGIFIENQSKNYQLDNVNVTGSTSKGIRMETETVSGSNIANIVIQYSTIQNNAYTGVFESMGNHNYYINNNISSHSNYGIDIYTDDGNAVDYISNNYIYNNGRGIYLEYSNANDIYDNIFCPSNTNVDIDVGFSTGNDGDDNTCEIPGSWNDAGATGCTYYCDTGASVTLLFPPNNYEDTDGNVDLVCESEDDSHLVNVSLYHNIMGTWQINQTRNISGTSNITTFSISNLSNGTNFIWNCQAYDNKSRGGFASANWSVSVLIDNIPPNVNIISPLNQTYDTSLIISNVSLNEEGICDYSIDNGATNVSMDTTDNKNFSATDSLANGNYMARFYCEDYFGNLNYTEKISFRINAPDDTHRFYIKDSSGNPVTWMGDKGNILLKGKCFSGGNCDNPGENSFIIRNSSNVNVAFINSTGDLCIIKGDCSDESAICNPVRDAFIIRNSSNYNMSYIDYDGDLCLTGKLYENSNP